LNHAEFENENILQKLRQVKELTDASS